MYKRTVEAEVNYYAKKWTCHLFCKILVSVQGEDESVWSVGVQSFYLVFALDISGDVIAQVPLGMHCFHLGTPVSPGMSGFFFRSCYTLNFQSALNSSVIGSHLLSFFSVPAGSLGGWAEMGGWEIGGVSVLLHQLQP